MGTQEESSVLGVSGSLGLLRALLPDTVAVSDTPDGLPDAPLFPEEAALMTRAVPKRLSEFRTTRACARAALGQLGVAPLPILRGARGVPLWPDGIVGSMTHCAGYHGAAVAPAAAVASLGVDAEPDLPLPDPGILPAVTLESERERIAELAALRPEVSWARLWFSAKESVYKTWFPLTGAWLGFDGAEITVDPCGTFTARLTVPGPFVDGVRVGRFEGRWLARDGLLATAITLPRG